MAKEKEQLFDGLYTQPMDVGSKGFDEFQAILLQKSQAQSEEQKRKVELLAIQYQMEDYIKSEHAEVKLAGQFLKHILKSLCIRQNKFAKYIGIKPSNLSKLLHGQRPINYDLALIFGRLFNHNPMLWVEIQAKNELQRLANAEGNNYEHYSLNELINRDYYE